MNYTVVGGGRVGSFLVSLNPESRLVGRTDDIVSSIGRGAYPIFVATRCDDLENVIERTPQARRGDLVFLQNGMIDSFLLEKGLSQNTQSLLYFAISKKGVLPIDGTRTVVVGKWGSFFSSLLQSAGIQCREISSLAYRAELAEKYLWNCSFGLLCASLQCTVGEVVQKHSLEAKGLISELAQDTARVLDISLDAQLQERLFQYSLSIPNYKGAVKEWRWRNGWLWERAKGPLHRGYLDSLGLL